MIIRSIRDLSTAIKGRRTDLGLSQSQLAARAHVSRKWVNEFEAGKPTAELQLLLRVLEALDLSLEIGAPGANASPREPDTADPPTDLDAILDDLRR